MQVQHLFKKHGITLSAKVGTELYTKDQAVEKQDTQNLTITPIGNIATVQTYLENEIYKGYLYENEAKETEYREINEINVSYIEGITSLSLNTNTNTFLNEAGQGVILADTRYKSTAINKEQLLSLLGNEGKVTIKRPNGEVIAEIGAANETDENGNIVVNYGENEKQIIIETTEPQIEGKLYVGNVKALNGTTNSPREVINQIRFLGTNAEINTNISKEGTQATLELKEPQTEATLELSRNEFTTAQENENVEIRATLQTNKQNQELYTNPSVLIEFPSDVKEVKVNSISKLFGDEFQVAGGMETTPEGKQAIRVNMTGEQKEHKALGTEGTMIYVDANLVLNSKATTKEDKIKMTYTNEKGTQLKNGGVEELPVKITSPKSIITANSIPQLGVETLGNEEGIVQNVDRTISGASVRVEHEIINNNGGEIRDVKVMGTFGTDGETSITSEREFTSNMEGTLLSPLTVEGDLSKAQIYYTTNLNANDNLEDAQNGWTTEIENPNTTVKYLVQIPTMQMAEGYKLSYDIKLGDDLSYNREMYEGYKVTYVEPETNNTNEIPASIISLQTGEGPQVKTELKGTIGGDEIEEQAQVKRGEIINFTARVTNSGKQDAQNVKVTANAPEGTTFVEVSSETGEYEPTGTTKEGTIEELKAGETKDIDFMLKVNADAKEGSEFEVGLTTNYANTSTNSNTIKIRVQETRTSLDVQVYTKTEGEVVTTEGEKLQTVLKITNESSEPVENVEAQWQYTDQLKFEEQGLTETSADENINNNKIRIEKLEPGETKELVARFTANETGENTVAPVSATVTANGETYQANIYENKIKPEKGVSIRMESTARNSIITSGEEVEYNILISNEDDYLRQYVSVEDNLADRLVIQEVYVTDQNGNQEPVEVKSHKITYLTSLEGYEQKMLTIKAKAMYDPAKNGIEEYQNQAAVYTDGEKTGETEAITTGVQNKGEDQSTQNQAETKQVSGYAWIDKDKNGSKDTYENTIPNVQV